jgi:hypothetical protein
MGGLLDELGRRLAERWLTLLVLPGALYLAVAVTGRTLGQAHALDLGKLTRTITAYATSPAVRMAGGQVVLLAAVLAGAAAIGLIAQGLGGLVERVALAPGWQAWPGLPRRLARSEVRRRQRRWDSADAAYRASLRQALAPAPADRPDPAARHRAARTRSRIALARPERPTWSGDRINATALRVDLGLHLDLATIWPALWLTLPDPARGEIANARAALNRATTLAAWSLLYAPITIWWWPAALVCVAVALTSRYRLRAATNTYALLLEAATRLYAPALIDNVGIPRSGPLTPELGDTLTNYLTPPESFVP